MDVEALIILYIGNGRIVTTIGDNKLSLWNIAEQKLELQLEGHSSPIFSIKNINDGEFISKSTKELIKWDRKTLKGTPVDSEEPGTLKAYLMLRNNIGVTGTWGSDILVANTENIFKKKELKTNKT